MSYVIATMVDGVPHAIRPNVDKKCFELIQVLKDSELSKAFCSPNKTGAVNILKWIKENDSELANKNLSVQPEARYFR